MLAVGGRTLIRYLAPLLLLAPTWVASGPAGATFPGANGKIVLEIHDGDDSELYKASPNGSILDPITDNLTSEYGAAVSPGGRRIAFTKSVGMGQPQVFIMKMSGEGGRRVTEGSGGAVEPTWTPNGEAIVFARTATGGGYELFKVRIGPEPRHGRRLTHTNGHEFESEVSSDGWIAFTYSLTKGQAEIVKMRLDGTHRRRLTDTPNRLEQNPTWAPSGNRIAFSTNPKGETADIASIRPDGTHRMRILDRPKLRFYLPTWSPNGDWIAATAFRGSSDSKIVRFRSNDGSPLDNVTTFSEGGSAPAWQPK